MTAGMVAVAAEEVELGQVEGEVHREQEEQGHLGHPNRQLLTLKELQTKIYNIIIR